MRHPIFHEPPQPGEGVEVELLGVGHDAAMRFYVWADVLDELWFAARWEPGPSVAVLTGLYGIAEQGPFIEVTGFDGFRHVGELSGLVAPVRETIEEAIADRPAALDARQPSPVGIFAHSPGSGAHLDPEIARLHMTLLNVPYQIALMADTGADALAMYARQPRGAFFNAAFHLVRPTPGAGEQE